MKLIRVVHVRRLLTEYRWNGLHTAFIRKHDFIVAEHSSWEPITILLSTSDDLRILSYKQLCAVMRSLASRQAILRRRTIKIDAR